MDDLDFIREQAAGEKVELPESLSKEAIGQKLAGVKPKKRKRGKIIAISVPAAAALFLSLAILVLPNLQLVHESVPYQASNQESIGFDNYDTIAQQLAAIKADYEQSMGQRGRTFIRFNGFGAKTADQAVERNGAVSGDMPAAYESAAEADYAADSTGKGSDYSETNLRDSRADEQDIIKTDGTHIFYLPSGGTTIYIVRADGAKLTVASKIERDGGGSKYYDYFTGMYLYGGKLIVTGEESFETPEYTYDYFTFVRIYDISDVSVPQQTASYRFKGMQASSRIVGGRLIMVTQDGFNLETFDEKDVSTFVPCYYFGNEKKYVRSDDLVLPANTCPNGYVNVFTLKLDGADAAQPEAVSVLADGAQVYCTDTQLFLYAPQYEFNRDDSVDKSRTQILSFDISGDKAVYKAKGTVDGELNDSFAIDASGGYLRLAVTEAEYGAQFRRDCRVVVLNENLEQVGATEGIADGESVQSVRFMGDTAYVVTFLNTDPLFVIDLKNPEKPAVVGEVKLPGFSSYLHPVGEGLLMGIGSGGTDSGLDGSAKVSLFDVKDPTAPKEISNLIFKESYLSSDYKAFVDLKDGSYLVGITEYANDYEDFSNSLLRIAVQDGALALKTRYLVGENEDTYDSVRGMFIGDTVYAAATLEKWNYPDNPVVFNDDGAGAGIIPVDGENATAPVVQIEEPDYTKTVFINAYDKDSGNRTGGVTLYQGGE